MKYLFVSLLLIAWFISTIILGLSFYGIIILLTGDLDDRWMKIPEKLISVLKEQPKT